MRWMGFQTMYNRCTSSLMGMHVGGRSQMIRRLPSRFRGVAIWAVLLAGWSIPTAGQHNVHAWSEKNPQFNVGQPVKGMANETKFAYPEMPLVIRDDVHKWESAFVGVFNHPFHTVSKSGGSFELKLPPGYYEITAWHETYGQKTVMVGVVDNERRVINITFAP